LGRPPGLLYFSQIFSPCEILGVGCRLSIVYICRWYLFIVVGAGCRLQSVIVVGPHGSWKSVVLAMNCLCRWSLSYSIVCAHLCLQDKFTEELEQKVDLNQV
jgi:hypothetical protein